MVILKLSAFISLHDHPLKIWMCGRCPTWMHSTNTSSSSEALDSADFDSNDFEDEDVAAEDEADEFAEVSRTSFH